MSNLNDGGPAHPVDTFDSKSQTVKGCTGLSKLEYFAAAAPAPSSGDVEVQMQKDRDKNPHNDSHKPRLRNGREIEAYLRFEWAAAMLAESERRKEQGQ